MSEAHRPFMPGETVYVLERHYNRIRKRVTSDVVAHGVRMCGQLEPVPFNEVSHSEADAFDKMLVRAKGEVDSAKRAVVMAETRLREVEKKCAAARAAAGGAGAKANG